MKDFIFLTSEGTTFQPNSTSETPDIENIQVIGFSSGKNSKEAFKNLLGENKYLFETSFNEVFCYELSSTYEKNKIYYYLKNYKELL